MFRWLLLLIIILPALEIGLFIWVGGQIGPWWVVALIFLTGIIGAWLAKYQGLETFYRAQQSMAQGIFPEEQIFDGLCILLGGLLLLSPGFITDAIGLLLLLPFTRRPLKASLQAITRKWMKRRSFISFRRF